MEFIKTFESFDKQPKQFLFYLLNDGPEFKAEVRDVDGKTIYTIDRKRLERGVMKSPSDLSGLRDYLISKKKIDQVDELIPAEGEGVGINTQADKNDGM